MKDPWYHSGMNTTNTTAAPITARRIPTGWLYEQAGAVVRKSRKGGDAYAFAVTINGSPVSFSGSMKGALAEKARQDDYVASCRSKVAKFQTEAAYVADYLASDQHVKNRAFWLSTDGAEKAATNEARTVEWCRSGWAERVEAAARVVAVATITVVG